MSVVYHPNDELLWAFAAGAIARASAATAAMAKVFVVLLRFMMSLPFLLDRFRWPSWLTCDE